MQIPQHEEAVNHALSPPDEWAGRGAPSNYHVDDWKAGRRWKSQLARSSGWNSACLWCHLICHDGVQLTLSDVWAQAKAPSQLLLPHLKECIGPRVRHLCQVCGWIHSYCTRLLEGLSLRGPSPIYSRSSKTEVVLQPEDWCHRFEIWWSCPSQGRCLSREEEDQG